VSRVVLLCLSTAVAACGASDEQRRYGSGTIVGGVDGLPLATENGVSIARSFPPGLEVKVSPGGLSCEAVQGGDRVTIDLGAARPGTYAVVVGYPNKATLSPNGVRVHVCPAKEANLPCHNQVRGGTVVVRTVEDVSNGRVEGTFEIELADGAVSGSFSAVRCN
jgi:hypothetical protein